DFDLISIACCMMDKAPVADDNNRGYGISSGNGKTISGRCRVAMRLPVLYHPDYDRRLWNHTRSADPVEAACGSRQKLHQALAGWMLAHHHRRWGISPRPENETDEEVR